MYTYEPTEEEIMTLTATLLEAIAQIIETKAKTPEEAAEIVRSFIR